MLALDLLLLLNLALGATALPCGLMGNCMLTKQKHLGPCGASAPVALCTMSFCCLGEKGVISSWAHSRFNQTALASSRKKDHCQDEFDVNARDVGKQNRLSDSLCGHLCSLGMKTRRTSG